MILPDVNVLVYAHREDSPRHAAARAWLEAAVRAGTAGAERSRPERIPAGRHASSRLRPPTPLDQALDFAEYVRSSPRAVRIHPGERRWEIFVDLCRGARTKGNLVPDAYLAAMAAEAGGTWISTDREYARFPGLRRKPPF